MGDLYIIHQSELIREGIASILRHPEDYRNQFTSIKLFENFKTAQSQILKSQHCPILIIENNLSLAELTEIENLQHIFLVNEENAQNKERSFNINTPTLHLIEQLNELQKDKTPAPSKGNQLTERETEVLQLLAFGHSNKDIAEKLFISIHTVMSHRKNITEKLGIKSVSGLTVYAIINNLIETEGLNLEDLI